MEPQLAVVRIFLLQKRSRSCFVVPTVFRSIGMMHMMPHLSRRSSFEMQVFSFQSAMLIRNLPTNVASGTMLRQPQPMVCLGAQHCVR